MSFVIVSFLTLLISISAFSTARVEAKPLNQNQVKFKRLPPKEFSAALGSGITIECEASGSPPPTIHWLKNGRKIQQNDFDDNLLAENQPLEQVDEVNKIGLSSTRSRLFIDCADYSDDAHYTCVAENAFSRISSTTKLNIIRPALASPVLGSPVSDNDLMAASAVDDLAAAASELVSGSTSQTIGQQAQQLSAVAQCLSQRNSQGSKPVRIHMWTHNIIEVMKNSVILFCRSNVRAPSLALGAATSNQLTQDLTTSTGASQSELRKLNKRQVQAGSTTTSKTAFLTWTSPDQKVIDANQKDKYEILDTGDLLIKDLRWSDVGSYVCMISDDQSSDSISIFVYPAAVKTNQKRASIAPMINNFR